MLDRLLDDNCIGFDGISATSVGAVNATVLAVARVPDMRWRTFGAALPLLLRSALYSQPRLTG